MQHLQRLNRELTKINHSPPTGISLYTKNEKLSTLEASITGPDNSPYSRGIFRLEILVPERYPFVPPSIKFLTKIYHPNIDDNGRICLDLLKMPPQGNWRPTTGLEAILIAIRMLLENPNPDDPLMTNIAEEFKNNNEEYKRKAELFTKQYALN